MSLVVLLSAKGSPGVTTTALALTSTWPLAADEPERWPGGPARVSLVDADLAGSGVAAGYLRGAVPDGASLVSVAVRSALSGPEFPEMVALDDSGRRTILLGVNDPAQATSIAPVLLPTIEALLGVGDVLVDLGRFTRLADMTAINDVVDRADLVLVVCRATLVSVSSTRHLVSKLRTRAARSADAGRLGLAVVGPGQPYPSVDVAKAVGATVLLELPRDAAAAQVFSDGDAPPWRFSRSDLLRSARAAAADLVQQLAPPLPATDLSNALPAVGAAEAVDVAHG